MRDGRLAGNAGTVTGAEADADGATERVVGAASGSVIVVDAVVVGTDVKRSVESVR